MVIRAFTPDVASIYNLIPSDRGRPLTDIVGRLAYDGLRDDVAEVLHTLAPLERRVSRRDGTAHYLLRILPYRTPDSMVDGSLVTFVDVTRIVEAEQHQRLLVDELNHRVKNMLAVVISLATQTLRRSGTLEEFSGVFLGRVHALTAAYTLLSRESWSGVQLQEIVAEELRPFMAGDRANIRVEGPPVPLNPRGALALGMAIHELATNAAKYGALSVPEGDVAVTWTVERHGDAEHLALDWTERNGPPVAVPARRGFGTTLNRAGPGARPVWRGRRRVPARRRAGQRQSRPAGRVRQAHRSRARRRRARSRAMTYPMLAGKRVLLVEDELLVAMLVEDMLADAGCVLVGPFARLPAALAAARVEAVDVALLDVNIAGEMVFPVAHVLEERGIPFLFVTGYGRAVLPPDRPHWRACAKPFQPERLAECLARTVQEG